MAEHLPYAIPLAALLAAMAFLVFGTPKGERPMMRPDEAERVEVEPFGANGDGEVGPDGWNEMLSAEQSEPWVKEWEWPAVPAVAREEEL